TLPKFHGSDSGFSFAAIAGFEGGLILLAAAIALLHRSGKLGQRHGVRRAILAGLLFALAGIAIKALTGGAGGWIGVVSLRIIVVACGGLAQYMAVSALQGGGAIETIGLMGLVANAFQIVGGILVFGDPLSPTPLGITLQITAFAMVCLSALLLPARPPRRDLAEALARQPAGGEERRQHEQRRGEEGGLQRRNLSAFVVGDELGG